MVLLACSGFGEHDTCMVPAAPPAPSCKRSSAVSAFPALAALAASCEGTSVLTGTQRLTYKESNRAETIAEVFGRLGIGVDLSEENTMRITGGPVSSAVVDSHNDHRIAMAAAVAALSSDDSVVIEGADAADKSYPNFWNDLDTLRS